MKATSGSPIQKPRLQILTSIEVSDNWATMSDRLTYICPEFREHPVGTRFAVLREMESYVSYGQIRQILAIL
jgi:hypothetical protein